MRLDLRDLTVLRGACPVVDHVTLAVEPGEFVGLIGPNGAGKTTLMRAAMGLLPANGHSSLAALASEARARAAAWLPQAREIAWPMAVADLVALGRLPHGGAAAGPGLAAVDRALDRMGLGAFRDRRATELSGGEQARVLIARALAQEAPVLLADEPTAGLDPAAQIGAMRVFAEEAAGGRTVLAALHDLGLAARHCTRLLVLSGGRLVADGSPRAVLVPEVLGPVFGIRAHLAETAEGLVFQPLETVGGADG